MADITQNITQTIGAKAPVQPPSQVAALQAFITGNSVPNIPQALQQSPPGQLISAFVLAANPKGQILLQTPQGQIAFTSSLPLAVGQQLVLETLPRAAPQQQIAGAAPPPAASLPLDVKLVRVNGVSAENAFPPAATTATHTPETAPQGAAQAVVNALILRAVYPQRPQQTRQEQSPAPSSLFEMDAVEYDPSPVQNQSRFRATVVNTPSQTTSFSPQSTEIESAAAALISPADLPDELAQLKTGDVLTLKIVGGTLAPQISNATASPVVVSATGVTAEAPQPSATLSTTASTIATAPIDETPIATVTAAYAQSGSAAEIPVEGEVPQPIPAPTNAILQRAFPDSAPQAPVTAAPQVPAAAANPPAFNTTVQGVVIGQDAGGEAVVQTAIATLRLPADVALPRGTQLSLNISDLEPALDLFAASQLPRPFQTGNVATDALLRGSTALDSLFKQIFGLNADAGKDAASALIPKPGAQFGNKIIEFIARVKDDSLPDAIRQALPKEMVAQLGLDRVGQEFNNLKQAMTDQTPQNWNYMLVPVMKGDEMSHMRWFKRKQKDEQDKEKEGTRFVVELETQSLGSVQIDGLFFDQPRAKKFDLVIRSNQEFSSDEQQKILEIYNSYGEITGYQGKLRFEQATQFPVQPLGDVLSGKNHEISA